MAEYAEGVECQCESCRLQRAAPKLYEALKYIIRELDKAGIIKADSIFMEMPNKAIAIVEGK